MIAADLRKRRPKPYTTWHLDEVYLKISGHMVYLWRAVDAEGEVLDVLVQSERNKHAALKLMRKLLKKYGFVPDQLITDDLRSYAAAAHDLGIGARHERGRWKNNRIENSHQPTRRRERKMQRFKARAQRKDFSALTLPSSTPSTSSATSLPLQRIALCAPRRSARGARQLRPLEISRAAGPSRSFVGNVTRPLGGVKVTEARRHAARPPSRERRSMPRGRATRPRQQSVSACRLAS